MIVLGIIVVLIATLVPLLGKAREAARRTVCLANQREVHRAFQLYALENDDRAPIGYRGLKQINSLIYSRPAGDYVLAGKLYPSGLLRDGSFLYCPSETDPALWLDTPQNPWPPGVRPEAAFGPPPGPDEDADAGQGRATPRPPTVRGGFALRPEYELPDDFARPPARLGLTPVPKLTRFGNSAVVADLSDVSTRLNTRHETGVNVTYNDGSGHWVARDLFADPLDRSTRIAPAFDDEQDEIWRTFDEN